MRLTVKIKLTPNKAEYTALFETLSLCNELANQVSVIAFEEKRYQKIKLQKRASRCQNLSFEKPLP